MVRGTNIESKAVDSSRFSCRNFENPALGWMSACESNLNAMKQSVAVLNVS
jgi:hypothetical protein